jgi:D-erythronate 2-dehydrogenase
MPVGGVTTIVTGAAGFLGRAVVGELRRHHRIYGDVIAADCVASEGVDCVGDIADPAHQSAIFISKPTYIFHLAGVVSGRAEADFVAGRRVNLDASLAFVERCRLQVQDGGPLVRFIYASSIAVFGVPPAEGMDDATPPAPCLSYGAHKRIVEVLIDDYSRRGFIDGRALRLSGVVVRPRQPNGALSAFNSDIFREPFAGRAYCCPLPSDATIWVSSLTHAVHNLLAVGEVDAARLDLSRAITAPALCVSLTDIAAAIGRVNREAAARIVFAPDVDMTLRDQFGSWPLRASFGRAAALALTVDCNIDDLIRTERARGAFQ